MVVMDVFASTLLRRVLLECEIAQRQVSAVLQLHESKIKLERDDKNLRP